MLNTYLVAGLWNQILNRSFAVLKQKEEEEENTV